MLRTRIKPRLSSLFVHHSSTFRTPLALCRESQPRTGKGGNPKLSDSSPNAIDMLSEPCHGAPADETIIHEYGQCFYTGLVGRTYELPRPRCSPTVTLWCHKSEPAPRGLRASLKSPARSTPARSVRPHIQAQQFVRPRETACQAMAISRQIAATPLPKSLHRHCHHVGGQPVRSRWARSTALALGYRFQGACTSP